MATTFAGKAGKLYLWNGTATAMTNEACDEVTVTAQITATTKRILSPNHSQVFTDSGGKLVTKVDNLTATATFNGNVTAVTCTGSYIAAANIVQVAQLYNWKLTVNNAIADCPVFGDSWISGFTTLPSWSGSIEGYFNDAVMNDAMVRKTISTVETKYWLIRLYLDSAKYYFGWVALDGEGINTELMGLVKETVSFKGQDYLGLVLP